MIDNGVEDLVNSYWGWMYAIQDTPVYREMRRKQLVAIRNEIRHEVGDSYKQVIKDGDPNRNKK